MIIRARKTKPEWGHRDARKRWQPFHIKLWFLKSKNKKNCRFYSFYKSKTCLRCPDNLGSLTIPHWLPLFSCLCASEIRKQDLFPPRVADPAEAWGGLRSTCTNNWEFSHRHKFPSWTCLSHQTILFPSSSAQLLCWTCPINHLGAPSQFSQWGPKMVNKLSQAAIHWLAQFRSVFHLIPAQCAHELARMTCCQEDDVRWTITMTINSILMLVMWWWRWYCSS